MATTSSTTNGLDAESSSPTLSSSQKPRYSGRPTREPSVESLQFSPLSNPSSGATHHPSDLKKRHSTYALSSSSLGSSPVGLDRMASLPPLPDMPFTATTPLRPPLPARPISHIPPPPQRKKPRSRPSTADSKDRSKASPWEFQSLKEETVGEAPPLQSKVKLPSVRSRASSASLGKPTGPVELVTPWEVQSLEEELVQIEKVYEQNPPTVKSRVPPNEKAMVISTGPVEEVTPWELHPVPVIQPQRALSTISNPSSTKGQSSTSLHVYSNLSSSNVSQHPPSSQPRSTHSRPFGHTDTGPVEDVTPWEVQPGPDNLGSPVAPWNATSSNFTPLSARRSTSRPSSAKGQGSGFASRPPSAKGGYSGAGLVGTARATPSLPSGGALAPSHSASSQSLASLKPNNCGVGTAGKVGGIESSGGVGPTSGSSVGPSFGLGPVTYGEPDTYIALPPAQLSQHSLAPSYTTSKGSMPSVESLVSRKPPSVAGRSVVSKQSYPQLQSRTRPAPTGPTEDVTPWELHPATLPLPDAGTSSRFLLKTPQKDKEQVVAERRLSSSKSVGNAESELKEDLAADNVIDPEDGLDTRTQARPAESASGNSMDGKKKQTRPAASMTLDELEEVMPWELYPPPPPPAVHPTAVGASESGVAVGKRMAPAETYGHGHKTLADFGLRRRRSTGGSGMTSSSGGNYGGQSTTRMLSRLKDREDRDRGDRIHMSSPTEGVISPLAVSPSSPLGISNAGASSPLLPPSQSNSLSTTAQPPKFSTADRTILKQLKANLQAREAQFILKGVGHTIVGGGRSPGKKYHPYSKEVVPYPRSYGREVVDLDVWETLFALDICGSLTCHVFETHPTKVLEIGCGAGTWILRCAEAWKECHFVGLDIVPLHPDLQNVGSDSASRITWVQHNFLDGLPFQNEEFDFVHIKRIALGVPEQKWDDLFEEIVRVMKPGGAFEMIEEDLFFPGKPADNDDLLLSMRNDDSPTMTRRISVSSDGHHTSLNEHEAMDKRSETPTTITNQMFGGQAEPSQSTLPVPARVNGNEHICPNEHREGEYQPLTKPATHSTQPPLPPVPTHAAPPAQVPILIYPHSRSALRPALHVKTEPHANLMGHPSLSGSTVSLLGSLGYIAHLDPLTEIIKRQQQQRERSGSQTSAAASTSPRGTKSSPFMLRSLTNSPTNPRDHTILEAIWNGMLGSRFVNLSPLSQLPACLECHFKDVRTHPPLMYTFPSEPVKTKEGEDEQEGDEEQTVFPSDSEPDTDDARDAVIPRPKRPCSTTSKKLSACNSPAQTLFSDNESGFSVNNQWLSMQVLAQNPSPSVAPDESPHPHSPSKRTALPTKLMKERNNINLKCISRLPNTTMNINLRTLNLHLALRAKEIIACSEPMWEWVLEYQAEASSGLTQRDGRNLSGPIKTFIPGVDGSARNSALELTKNVILEMTRDDFDSLLNNFEMDMQDKASVGNALQERFSWRVFPSPILQDRKVFDTACEKYGDWVTAQKAKSPSNPYRNSNIHHSRNSISTPGLVLPTPDSSVSHDHNQISRSTSSPQPSTSRHVDDTCSIASTLVPSLTESHHHHHNSVSTVHFTAALSSPSNNSQMSTQSTPTQILSRAMRVFVAWKAS